MPAKRAAATPAAAARLAMIERIDRTPRRNCACTTRAAVRGSRARVAREAFADPKADVPRLALVARCLGQLLADFRHEELGELRTRLDELERRLDGGAVTRRLRRRQAH